MLPPLRAFELQHLHRVRAGQLQHVERRRDEVEQPWPPALEAPREHAAPRDRRHDAQDRLKVAPRPLQLALAPATQPSVEVSGRRNMRTWVCTWARPRRLPSSVVAVEIAMGAKPLESAPTGMRAKKCQVEEHSAEAVLWMIERMEPMLNEVVLPLTHDRA